MAMVDLFVLQRRVLHKTYAACTSMTGLRLLIGLAAYENRLLMASDAINAYAQSGPLEKTTYLVDGLLYRSGNKQAT